MSKVDIVQGTGIFTLCVLASTGDDMVSQGIVEITLIHIFKHSVKVVCALLLIEFCCGVGGRGIQIENQKKIPDEVDETMVAMINPQSNTDRQKLNYSYIALDERFSNEHATRIELEKKIDNQEMN